MMASIPNMRSTPLPVPNSKASPVGDAAPGGFSVEMPATPEQAQAPGTPGQPCLVAPPLVSPMSVDLTDGVAPNAVEAEGPETGNTGEDDGTEAAKAGAKDDGETPPGVVIPFIQQPVPGAPLPRVQAAVAGVDTLAAPAANPARLPAAAEAKNDAPVADLSDAQTADDADAVQSAVKALLQRKPPPTKQIAAAPRAVTGEKAQADLTPAKAAPQAAQTPSAPATAQASAQLPIADLPQPALSPVTPRTAPAAADKAAAIEGTSAADLAVERKLDLTRDSAWLDRLARDIARAASDDSPLRFRLHPQTLGSLQVELQQGDRGAAVRMTVDTEAARQILSDAQPRLAAEARAQGVRIAETHVEMSSNGRQAPGDQRRQDDASQTPFIRTAGSAGSEANAARTSRRTRLDRYA